MQDCQGSVGGSYHPVEFEGTGDKVMNLTIKQRAIVPGYRMFLHYTDDTAYPRLDFKNAISIDYAENIVGKDLNYRYRWYFTFLKNSKQCKLCFVSVSPAHLSSMKTVYKNFPDQEERIDNRAQYYKRKHNRMA